jgi:transposase
VLDEPGREAENKSYMWVFRGGGLGNPVVYFQYDPSRSGEVARGVLSGYRGYVQTDGYQAYSFIDKEKDMIHVGCWAHARRKFYEVTQASEKGYDGRGKAKEALRIIRDLYLIEQEAKDLGLEEEEIYRIRQERSKPIVEDFFKWAKETAPKVPPQLLLGKAFKYALTQEARLMRYLENGMLRMDNNIIENAIRPFVVGRKNWLFSETPDGARASAAFYSLIETAKANGLNPYKYLLHLFEEYPKAGSNEEIFSLLPMYAMRPDIESLDPKADIDKMPNPPPQQ